MIEWPVDKLAVMNSALAQLHENQIAVLGEGSDEERCCSPAYERALAFALEDHGWVHATTVATLVSTGVAPLDTQYDTAYAFPPNLLHLIWVRQNDAPAIWTVLNNQIYTRANGWPGPVTCKYISTLNSDIQNGTPTLVFALETYVKAAIMSGLKEEHGEGRALRKEAEGILARARATSDAQKPRRSLFNSRLTMSRRVRKPWNTTGGSWGGTGTPSS